MLIIAQSTFKEIYRKKNLSFYRHINYDISYSFNYHFLVFIGKNLHQTMAW